MGKNKRKAEEEPEDQNEGVHAYSIQNEIGEGRGRGRERWLQWLKDEMMRLGTNTLFHTYETNASDERLLRLLYRGIDADGQHT